MTKKGISIEKARAIRRAKGIQDSKLQKARLKKGLSQKQLAAVTGIGFQTIQCYEQGTRAIEGAKLNALCKICLALDCKIEDILEDNTLVEKFKMVK